MHVNADVARSRGVHAAPHAPAPHSCSAQTVVFCVSFTCESFLVALTVLQLMTASRDPRLRGDAAEEEAERLRGDIIVTALSFALTCAAFAAAIAMQVSR